MTLGWIFLVFSLVSLVKAVDVKSESDDEAATAEAQFADDVVVADAVFRGVYVGIVRMIQKISTESSGAPYTTVMVQLKYNESDTQSTTNHMWHVEHDPITDVDCAASNKHFAPFGITKQTNYTTYCSNETPDFCEIGDISTKTTLTGVGKGTMYWYSVPLLPLTGPWTVIGHSVNVHGGNKSKVRQACGNIVINKRMTSAREVKVAVKIPENLLPKHLNEARRAIARHLEIPISKVHTAERLDMLAVASGCSNMTFLVFGRGMYKESKVQAVEEGSINIGQLSSASCSTSGKTNKSSDSKPASCTSEAKEDQERNEYYEDDMNDDNVVVADAVFRGVYTGVVRMVQKVTSGASGYPRTKVIVRLKNASDDKITEDHMWHVEHDPISDVDCAEENKHFAPYGITKQNNYTTYCSGNTPDYCELGDISSKTGLTSVGKDVVKTYWVPLLPIVGPRTMIGHSVNVHGGEKSKIRKACGNIALNTRITRAQMVDIPIKNPAMILEKSLDTARIKISQKLGISLSKIHTAVRLDTLVQGCTKLQFLIFDRGNFCPEALKSIEEGKVDIGDLSPTDCRISRRGDTITVENGADNAKSSALLAVILLIFSIFSRKM